MRHSDQDMLGSALATAPRHGLTRGANHITRTCVQIIRTCVHDLRRVHEACSEQSIAVSMRTWMKACVASKRRHVVLTRATSRAFPNPFTFCVPTSIRTERSGTENNDPRLVEACVRENKNATIKSAKIKTSPTGKKRDFPSQLLVQDRRGLARQVSQRCSN